MRALLATTATLGLICLAIPVPTPWAAPSPYAGQELREIKALSADDVAALGRGDGMGLAKAAELNRYPGPKHVLEFAEPLALTPDQRASTERLYAEMRAEAVAVGQKILSLERELDANFRGGSVDEGTMTRLTAALGTLQGQLRATHLRAHVRVRALLTPGQIERYQQLRGYTGGTEGHMPSGEPPAHPR